MKSGIDISHHNGTIDFKLVKQSGIEFAYIKATEGVTFIDNMAQTYARGCATNGINFGFYHFAQPRATSPVNEADYFTRQLKQLPPGTLMPVLDLETNPGALSPDALQQWVLDFVFRMAQNGYPKIMLYGASYFLNTNLPQPHKLGSLPLWVASYNTIPSIPKGFSNFQVWQFTDKGAVPGISGNVDLDRADVLPLLIGGSIAVILLLIAAGYLLFLYK